MIISRKTEISLNKKQIEKFQQDCALSRRIHDMYQIMVLKNLTLHGEYVDYKGFLAWFYKYYLKKPKNYLKFPRNFNSDNIRQSVKNADKNLQKYIRGEIKIPGLKGKDKYVSVFVSSKNGTEQKILAQRHRIYVPTYGWIKLKEKGYIPANSDRSEIICCYISFKTGRYYISTNIKTNNGDYQNKNNKATKNEPIGIDLGLQYFAVLSDGHIYENINHKDKIKRIEKHIAKKQKALNRKVKNKTQESGKNRNTKKNIYEVQKLYKRLNDKRNDYLNKVIAEIIKYNPKYVAIEDLVVKTMVNDRKFSKGISDESFRTFRIKLIKKCHDKGIEVRVVNRYYPSSKRCHNCGNIKQKLFYSDRIYKCDICGYETGRDYNASLNIRDAKDYFIAKLESY